MCWFDSNHPDGCPRKAEDCPFKHKCEVAAEGNSPKVIAGTEENTSEAEVSQDSVKAETWSMSFVF